MSQIVDLKELLDSWPYDGRKNVRIVRADNGRDVLQVRLPLGIEQYELEGRPDGRRPHSAESALNHHLERLATVKGAGKGTRFALSAEECAELFEEGVLYYYRYLHLFQIEEWERVMRDTTRNLTLFDFVRRYAQREEDRTHLEQWRPYITRIHAVSSAMVLLAKGQYSHALKIVHSAIQRIEAIREMDQPSFQFEKERSLVALREMARQIEKSTPPSAVERLERDLRKAIELEEYERAAELRDRIEALRSTTKP